MSVKDVEHNTTGQALASTARTFTGGVIGAFAMILLMLLLIVTLATYILSLTLMSLPTGTKKGLVRVWRRLSGSERTTQV